MTVAAPEPTGSNIAVPYEEDYTNLGMEDVGVSDIIIPRLRMQKDGTFINNTSKEVMLDLMCVVVGVVKQRVMWDSKVEDNDRPQCKSPNAVLGFPQLRTDIQQRLQFPWDRSNFTRETARPIELEPSPEFPDGWSSNGLSVLPCESCTFKEWGKDRTPPACSEQYTFVLNYTQDGGESHTGALLTLSKTGVKPAKEFISAISQRKANFFSVYSRITLNVSRKGTNEYAVPSFKIEGPTDRMKWRSYADQYLAIRSYLRQAPRPADDDTVASSATDDPWATESMSVAPTATPVPATPVAPVAETPASSPPVAPPVAAPPAPSVPAPAPAAAAPPVPSAPAVAPPAPSVQAPPAAAPAVSVPPVPTEAPQTGGPSEDDLPF